MEIKEVELLTDQLEETQAFYGERMGFEILYADASRISFKTGASVLTFLASSDTEAKYHFAFNIPHNQLNEAIQWMSDKTDLIKVENEVIVDFPNWNAKSIYFYDSVGNILEFIARYGLSNTSGRPFDVHSILSISEIGIATDEPLKLAEQLNKEYGVPYFAPGPKREDFAAMGNDEGLLVISKTTRNWYPTNIPAHTHFQKIKLYVECKEINLSFNA